MCCFRNQYQNQRGKNFRHSLYWIFTPGIALESWKILSGNFLFLELKNPGKFFSGRKLSWNFLKNNFAKKYFSWNLQFWNFPFLEFSIPGILSWNFLFLESYFTEFSCYRCITAVGFFMYLQFALCGAFDWEQPKGLSPLGVFSGVFRQLNWHTDTLDVLFLIRRQTYCNKHGIFSHGQNTS